MSYSLDQVREWGLVLDAEDIPYAIDRDADGGWTLVVAPSDAERCREALSAYVTENFEPAIEPAAQGDLPIAVMLLPLLFLVFHSVSSPHAGGGERIPPGSAWLAAGAADGAAIRAGEWWRLVTALTLHADLGHVMANAVIGLVLALAVAISLGAGPALWLIVLAGAAGNGLNVWTRGASYSGIGFSTAVFGAVGILAGYRFARPGRRGADRRSAWLALGTGLALLALFGMDPDTDVLAHFWGFVAGLPLGILAGRRALRPPGRVLDAALLAGLAAFVVACWWLALGPAAGAPIP